MKAGPERLLWDEYLRRISWPLNLKEVEERKPMRNKDLIAREGELLLNSIPSDAFLVALDRSGKSISSQSLAQLFQGWILDNQKNICFVIGGVEGLKSSLIDQANLRLSLGSQTWPHLLVRCMLLEQIYRAQCILTNHPYHR